MKLRVAVCLLALLATFWGQALAADITGTVKDSSGAVLSGAKIQVLSPQRGVVATGVSDASGKFTIKDVPDGQYVVVVQYKNLATAHIALSLSGSSATVNATLSAASVVETVTVTATPGMITDPSSTSRSMNLISADDIAMRAKTVIAQAVEDEAGVNLQRTSPTMAGIYVRGLTGNKVNTFVDGVRFSTGAQRGGVNTFLNLIDPVNVEGIEILRGTASAQYGSDALGGSVQFLTQVPELSTDGTWQLSGAGALGMTTAHQGTSGSALFRLGGKRFGLLASFGSNNTGRLRPGQGIDSHAAATRFLGVSSDKFYPEHLPGTEFHQISSQLRANWILSPNSVVTFNHVMTRQDDGKRYDQIDGGDGNLISDLRDMQLNLFYTRYERLNAGIFDSTSFTYSFNTQREERVNQGGQGSKTATINFEPERTTVHGIQWLGTMVVGQKQALLFGADMYFEKVGIDATNLNPVTGAVTPRRGRVPDGASYHQHGVFVQDTFKFGKATIDASMRIGQNKYAAKAADAPVVGGVPLWPDDSLSATSATFRAGVAYAITSSLTATASASTGYRAPHITDLGTYGVTGSGFEIASTDVAGLDAFVGTSAGATAVSSGKRVEQLKPETSRMFDGGVRFHSSRFNFGFSAFVNQIGGNIQKQALILPQGAIGTSIGGTPITGQNASGTVLVAASATPVLVRANFDDAKIWGVEWSSDFGKADRTLRAGLNYTLMRATDTTTNLPPNIEGGTPAPGGSFWVRFMAKNGRWAAEPYVRFAAEQTHLSSLDLEDRRTAAPRTRTNIQNFFRNGATNRGWVSAGPDGIFGNADDILIVTGETLAQVQDRVLGAGVTSGVLHPTVPGYAVYGLRFTLKINPGTLLIDAENLGDKNYRGISWGMDAPGRGISFRYLIGF